MPQLADLISRLFTSGRTAGLSGGAEVLMDNNPAAAFYASRLRRHRVEGDLVTQPEVMWGGADKAKLLRGHILSERGDGIASFTDVLLVINQSDARRAATVPGEPWTERVARLIGERFSSFCQQERFELLYGTRPLRFWIIADGGSDMLGKAFGLEPGEFVSGLLPNLYIGPARRSRPVLAVHLNLPGVWEGYREVGRLYSDQIVFTLGSHWLDNYHHPSLREPGIYRLQQYPDGSLVHVINPELQDRYLVRSDQTDAGPSVLTIAEFSGRPVAYLVLAVIESTTLEIGGKSNPISHPEAATDYERTEAIAVGKVPEAERAAESVPPAMVLPTPEVVVEPDLATEETRIREPEAEMEPVRIGLAGGGAVAERAKTIVPDAVDGRFLTLHERGALLQRVHFGNFMEGYDVYIGAQGKVATQMSNPRATLQIRQGRVSLILHDRGVKVDGRAVEAGRPFALSGAVRIDVDGALLDYTDLSGIKVDGWPYVGELRRPGVGSYLDFGGSYRIGRDRRCKIRLPDEPHNENIAWLPSVGGGATIRSRNGDIPKSRFYTDSIMVASEHAEVDVVATTPMLRSLARHCYSYVRRGNEIIALYPREGAGGLKECALQSGDELLIGNCLFQVTWPLQETGKAPPPTPLSEPPRFSAASLAAAVDPAISLSKVSGIDLVGAHNLGEGGPAPKPVRLTSRPSSTGGASSPPVGKGGAPSLPPSKTDQAPRAPVDAPSVPPVRAMEALKAAEAAKGLRGGSEDATQMEAPSPVVPPAVVAPAAVASPAATPPAATPRPAGARPPPPPMMLEEPGDPVRAVDAKTWQQELSRPARLLQVGWSVSGEVSLGNHRGVALVVPEVRSFPEQAFMTLDYFRIFVRGKKGRVELLQEGEASLHTPNGDVTVSEDLDHMELEVIRRDENLEPDFSVNLRFDGAFGLPDPRARLLSIDAGDRFVAAIFTFGVPTRAERRIRLGPVDAIVTCDSGVLRVSDYLNSYRQPDGTWQSFFWQEADGAWRTFPEDGSPVDLRPGQHILAGISIFRFSLA